MVKLPEMTKEIIILAGVWGVGKTHFAHNFVRENPQFTILDAQPNLSDMFNTIAKYEYVIMDYYFAYDKNAEALKQRFNCPIQIIVLFDKPENINYRQIFYKNQPENEAHNIYNIKSAYFDELPELLDMQYANYYHMTLFKFFQYNEFKELMDSYYNGETKEDIEEFIGGLKIIQGYDWAYHEIDLPFDLKIEKKNYNWNKQTWDIIKDLINFESKKVLDLGCFHGYFCREILKKGGFPIGVERHLNALYTCSVLNKILKTPFKLLKIDLDNSFPKGEFDVALVLNVFHHIKNQNKLIEELKKIPEIIFEINHEDKGIIASNFKIVKEIKSPRGRLILITSSNY